MIDKNIYIIAGCNGAGKTTASFTILPEIIACKEFVNADEIAKGISPFKPEGVALMLHDNIAFFWLQNVKLAKERVKIRVSEGGHNIHAYTPITRG